MVLPPRARSQLAGLWRLQDDQPNALAAHLKVRLPELVRGIFVQRDNRFRATVLVDDRPCAARVASSGRMQELLVPGATIWLAPALKPGRRTTYDLLLVEHGDTLVSVDSHLPNRLWPEFIQREGWLGEPVHELAAERPYGSSRLDFVLTAVDARTWMEVKSVTLVQNGRALFPDAPTTRGTRHVQELTRAVAEGDRAAVIFVIQRNDAATFSAHVQADPLFAATLVEASQRGVAVHAYACEVTISQVTIERRVPVYLE